MLEHSSYNRKSHTHLTRIHQHTLHTNKQWGWIATNHPPHRTKRRHHPLPPSSASARLLLASGIPLKGSGEWSWIPSLWSVMKCPIVSFGVSMGFAWLWAACLLMLRAEFLFCWRISFVCLTLELVGSWVVFGFSVSMEAFG